MDLEDNWFSLIERMKDREVVPVVGPALLSVAAWPDGSGAGHLLDRVAADVLASLDLDPGDAAPPGGWRHFDAVAMVMAERHVPIERLRRTVARAVVRRAGEVRVPAALGALAAIDAFDLYVSLTCDNLLQRALQEHRPSHRLVAASFSPRAASDTQVDVPPLVKGEVAVFQLFGSAASLTDFAIHDEDALEALYAVQSEPGRRLPNVLRTLREKDVLFIGCELPDWLGRTLLRLVNKDRLFGKSKQEFLVQSDTQVPFTHFISRFSPNTLLFPGDPAALVEELAHRWAASGAAHQAPDSGDSKSVAGSGPTVFVSYASENRDAARRVADALRSTGFADVWLDQRKLVAGDSWSHRIDDAIEQCDYFMPLLSHEADGRRDGVYWQEWRKAIDRSQRIRDEFILPLGLDESSPESAGYRYIAGAEFKPFFNRHLLHAPGGVIGDAVRQQLSERVRQFHEGRA